MLPLKYPKEQYPKISVMMPIRNGVKYVETAIKSLLAQEYPNLEFMVMDALSTDGTLEVFERYKDHISYFRSRKDLGAHDAINEGIDNMTGDIMHLLNSDDYYGENTLIRVGEAFIENPDVEMVNVLGKVIAINPDGSETLGMECTTDMMYIANGKVNVVHPNCRFIKKSVFDKYGKIIDNIDGKNAAFADFEFIMRLSLNNVSNITLPFLGYIYIAHEGSISFNNNKYTKLKMYDETVFYVEQLFKNYSHLMSDDVKKDLNRRYKKAYPRRVVRNLKDGNYKLALANTKLGMKIFGPKFLWMVARYLFSYHVRIRNFIKKAKL